MLDAKFSKKRDKTRRRPYEASKKDLGLVLKNTGINKNSIVLDEVTGCAFSALFFSQFCKKVYTYEEKEDFYNLAKKNIDLLEAKNITIKNKDINKKIDEKKLDLIFLDDPKPWLALTNCNKTLKQG